ncbi:hypothetical protein BJ875DRAFT_138988 [Amylocarpus encephaloides]|uniref:Uncharacterized protein n=1 Tax=Amylocarpus encephaloides TaxID=45428 RepID=A0A9P7YD75_9HELO|nr:hypothetical protein BJ875DRAFT_138988 [Amylocarpus encephaloides]
MASWALAESQALDRIFSFYGLVLFVDASAFYDRRVMGIGETRLCVYFCTTSRRWLCMVCLMRGYISLLVSHHGGCVKIRIAANKLNTPFVITYICSFQVLTCSRYYHYVAWTQARPMAEIDLGPGLDCPDGLPFNNDWPFISIYRRPIDLGRESGRRPH